MAIFVRPIADISRGAWTTNTGATTNLFASIDDDPFDDADFVQSPNNANDACEFRLGPLVVPPIRRLHVLNYRVRKSATLGNTRGVTVSLVQGATVIASQSHPDLTISAGLPLPLLLTRAEAASITDYTDLRIRFTGTGTVSGSAGSRRAVWATWAQFRVPDATDLLDDWRSRWGFPAEVTTLDQLRGWFWANWIDNDPVFQRRFNLVTAVWKLQAYRSMLDQINAGTYPLPAHQTQAFAATKIAAKITHWQGQADTLDAEDSP